MSMNPQHNATRRYLRDTVMSAPPERLQLMLYDAAIKYAGQGRAGLEACDYEAAYNAFDRAQRIVGQLAAGLNRDVNPELVDQLRSLYDFVFRRLIDANTSRELAAVDDAVRILRHMRETWELLIKQANGEAPADPTTPRGPAVQTSGTPGRGGGALQIEG